MAEANMTMISRAEITSITDATTGRKALVLDGTTIELGDTGLRDLSGMFVAGSVESGRVLVQRVGNVVTWTLSSVKVPAGTTTIWKVLESAEFSGLLPPVLAFAPMMGTSTNTSRVVLTPAGKLELHYTINATTYTGVLTFQSHQAWPTALPGVANGQPVGV